MILKTLDIFVSTLLSISGIHRYTDVIKEVNQKKKRKQEKQEKEEKEDLIAQSLKSISIGRLSSRECFGWYVILSF